MRIRNQNSRFCAESARSRLSWNGSALRRMDEKPWLPRRELSPGKSPPESYFRLLQAAASDEKITHEDEADSDHIVGRWVDYRGYLPPVCEVTEDVPKLKRDQIIARSYVGGLVKSFERKAA